MRTVDELLAARPVPFLLWLTPPNSSTRVDPRGRHGDTHVGGDAIRQKWRRQPRLPGHGDRPPRPRLSHGRGFSSRLLLGRTPRRPFPPPVGVLLPCHPL